MMNRRKLILSQGALLQAGIAAVLDGKQVPSIPVTPEQQEADHARLESYCRQDIEFAEQMFKDRQEAERRFFCIPEKGNRHERRAAGRKSRKFRL